MDLFHFREESPGSVFWHERGWSLFQNLINYMRGRQDAAGYKEIKLFLTLKKLVKSIKLKLSKAFLKMKNYQFIIMEIPGMIFVEDPI